MADIRLATWSDLLESRTKYGRFSFTPLVEGLTVEFRMALLVQSIRLGYYALAVDGKVVSSAVPVNMPLPVNAHILGEPDKLSVAFYDLRDIRLEGAGSLLTQSLDSTLNQKWFEVKDTSPVSCSMYLEVAGEVAGVIYGTLV